MTRSSHRDDPLEALERLGDEPLPGEASDADIVAGALAGLAAPSFLIDEVTAPVRDGATASRPKRPSRPLLFGIAAAVTVAAAAVALVFIGLPRLDVWRDGGRDPGSLAPAIHESDDDPREASERTPAPAPRTRPAKEPPLPEAELELVETSGTPDEADTESADTDDGDEQASRRRTPIVFRTADALLSHAQEQLRDGKTRAAMRTYRRLVERFPESREAKAALVSMGRLALKLGEPKRALGHFDAYLAASAGPLVEEARYGRIRALRALGRDAQELKSIDAFLADHGTSIYAPRLKKRAEELRAK